MRDHIRDQVFISHAHQGREWLNKRLRKVKPAVRDDGIKVWTDQGIQQEMRQAMSTLMASAPPSLLRRGAAADNRGLSIYSQRESTGT